MGTGLFTTLLGLYSAQAHWLLPIAGVLYVLASALLVGLTVAFFIRCVRHEGAFTDTLKNFAVIPLWGAVAMALLSVGAATLTVLPLIAPELHGFAVRADAVLWTVGTALGLTTALGFTAAIVVRHPGRPLPVWGLPLVPPTVSATTGTALVPFVPNDSFKLILVIMTVACFFVSIVLGFVIFAVAFHHHIRVENIPLEASISSWIPLGVVGQSMAATQTMAQQSDQFLLPFAVPTVHWVANVYGFAMLAAVVPVVTNAIIISVRGFKRGMPFNPGWWALTFPAGTVTLGTKLLGASTGIAWISGLSVAFLCLLSFNWLFCAISMALAARRHRMLKASA